MKRLLTTFLILIIALSTANAEFRIDLNTPAPSTKVNRIAPSYNAMANVEADEVLPSIDGGTLVKYCSVSLENFNKFINYLMSLGYSIDTKIVNDDNTLVQVVLNNNEYKIDTKYDSMKQELNVAYESGVIFERESPIPEYKRSYLDETISIPDLGDFIFTEFVLNGEITYYIKDISDNALYGFNPDSRSRYSEGPKYKTWCIFTYINKTEKTHKYTIEYDQILKKCKGELFAPSILYIEEQKDYLFSNTENFAYGSYNEDMHGIVHAFNPKGIKSFRGFGESPTGVFVSDTINPLETYHGGITLGEEDKRDLPEAVRLSSSGSLYLLIDFATGDKYAIVLREDGVNYYQ